ncbi:hypothetical protein FACS1894130_10260 [Spirochaetia bacterium]|nr:hypothetical protein FACS1894130_10260 [Spirochaetia bacterium]
MITIQQTVDIPASHRLTIEVPREVPVGRTILTFTPADTPLRTDGDECPLCAVYNEPNEETLAAFKEGDAMLRGEKPAIWHHSLEDLDKMLGL